MTISSYYCTSFHSYNANNELTPTDDKCIFNGALHHCLRPCEVLSKSIATINTAVAFVQTMEVLLRRGCCVWCNTEAVAPPQPLNKCGQHGGGRPLRKRLTLISMLFIACLVLMTLLTLAYSRVLTWVVEALLTTLVEGLEVCWLHLLLWWKSVGQLFPNNTSMVETKLEIMAWEKFIDVR